MISAVKKIQSDARRKFSIFYKRSNFLSDITEKENDKDLFKEEIEKRIELNYIRADDIDEEYLYNEGIKFLR